MNGDGCQATLAILPKAYIGWNLDFSKDALSYRMGQSETGRDLGHVYTPKAEVVAQHRVRDAAAIVDRLWDMYREGTPKSIMNFGGILHEMCNFEEAREKCGQKEKVKKA